MDVGGTTILVCVCVCLCVCVRDCLKCVSYMYVCLKFVHVLKVFIVCMCRHTYTRTTDFLGIDN